MDDMRINMSAFNAAKHNIIATHIANKRNDVQCLAYEHIINNNFVSSFLTDVFMPQAKLYF